MIAFGWFMLIIWPIVGIVFYQKYSMSKALVLTMLGGYLLLPSKLFYDLPLLPAFNKDSVPTLTALMMSVILLAQKRHGPEILRGWLPREPVSLALLVLLFGGVFATILTNPDPLVYGTRFLPALKMYDALFMSLQLLVMIAPFLLARRFLATPEAQRMLVTVFVIGALLYTLPTMWEIRLSPQLHKQIYGFYQHSFLQQVRNGGFRAMVFLNHGLSLSIFLALATVGACVLFRSAGRQERAKWALAIGWLLIVLVFSKSLGPLMIAVVLVPVALFLTQRTQLLAAACIAGVMMTYPLSRAADLVPVDRVLSFAESVSPQRAQSMEYRLRNEDILLEKARERPVFGWGIWSRNRVYNTLGRDISVTDGLWVLQLGIGGWVRYIAIFGLLCWPCIGLFLSKRDRIDPISAVLALMLAGMLVNLIPNAGLVPFVWLMAGSLLGRLEIRMAALKQTDQSDAVEPDLVPVQYTRDFGDPHVTRDSPPDPATPRAAPITRSTAKRAPVTRETVASGTLYARNRPGLSEPQ